MKTHALSERPVWHYRQGITELGPDLLAVERQIAIFVGDMEAARLMATPGNECELALGFAITMGWLAPLGPAPACHWDEAGLFARVEARPAAPPETGPRGSGGGGVGPLAAAAPPNDFQMHIDLARSLTKTMTENQKLFPLAGSNHSAAVFSAEGRLISLHEDIGRHNALDKAVGAAWLAGELPRARAMALSGRASLEMVLKAARAGMALVVSVSAPSLQGVLKAREVGMTLLGFSRKGRVNVYTHPHRVGLGE